MVAGTTALTVALSAAPLPSHAVAIALPAAQGTKGAPQKHCRPDPPAWIYQAGWGGGLAPSHFKTEFDADRVEVNDEGYASLYTLPLPPQPPSSTPWTSLPSLPPSAPLRRRRAPWVPWACLSGPLEQSSRCAHPAAFRPQEAYPSLTFFCDHDSRPRRRGAGAVRAVQNRSRNSSCKESYDIFFRVVFFKNTFFPGVLSLEKDVRFLNAIILDVF